MVQRIYAISSKADMQIITTNYIDGDFRKSSGTSEAPLYNPATEQQIGTVRLSTFDDVDAAVSAAKASYPSFSATSIEERVDMLGRLAEAVAARSEPLATAMREEYGAPSGFVSFSAERAGTVFLDMARAVIDYPWRQTIGSAEVEMRPLGVAAAITPWNSNIGFICAKLATAVAAGSPIVIKPSEMSAIQTQLLLEALHQAGLPRGVLNVVNGDGQTCGSALTAHPDVAKISFTGSTATGRAILRAAADTMKRVTLELGGKGAQIILDDADLDRAAEQALTSGFMNSGQACIAGTRVLIPSRLKFAFEQKLAGALSSYPVGPASDPAARIGPMVSQKQWERVQSYIALGIEEGARVIAGGLGRPDELDRGWFVRPTVFSDVDNGMRVAREEIFGPVLCILSYEDDDDAVRIANDTSYGLQNYVLSGDVERARKVARQLDSGRVVINGAPHEPMAPFGGFRQSGMGREYGAFGLTSFLEPRAILT
ncbi:aldehyde dehydrogenase family protein [Flavisphingomonas formosensis]|uniref:aldehyde dehydrogenase family protein n=1 Tax=Flavisphingomonas formosensis TaxID=861534 RepID=UPI001E562DF5|nr:aldehyde dehydrogenase family protein [Sphingomonas formosensis]